MKKTLLVTTAIFLGLVLFNWKISDMKQAKEQKKQEKIEKYVKESVERQMETVEEKQKKSVPQEKEGEASDDKISFLKGYKEVSKKFLMTREERESRKEMLQDEDTLRKSFLYLSKNDPSEALESRIENSMKVIDFLRESISWSQNPNRDSAIQKSKYFLMNDILETVKNPDRLRSTATDKAELYLLLKKVAPEQAAQIRDMARGSKLMAVIQYAETNM
ncbi:MAG: hypothetical protein HRT44_02485 [Bdellovibrionales bacterium]|nr:hypothetical protein [Bdellovibrionales bacterium]NQZ18115.1 hypothetical protein [Bdellovibrionales bacterium]